MTQCFRCEATLEGVMGSSDTQYHFDNALWLGFFGGYAMFTDNMDSPKPDPIFNNTDYVCVLCHECAHKFMDENPWLKNLFHPFNSHSHTTAYITAHPDHFGWDYASREIAQQFPGLPFDGIVAEAFNQLMDEKIAEDLAATKSD